MRIVSVLPSATEIVCALGARGELVGRSAECDYPDSVRSLPVVMHARTLDADRPSREIDARVRAALDRKESLYELDVDALARLRPDLLLTQDLCRVCSVTDAEAVSACRSAGVAPRILSLAPTRADEVWSSIESIGSAIGRPSEGRALAERLRARVATAPPGLAEARVAVMEWLDPPIEAGLWAPDLIRSAGGTPWHARPGAVATRGDWEPLFRDPPDLAILSPCSFGVDRTVRELEASPLGRRLADWRVPKGVWVADEAYFSRPGPRLADGRDLVEALLERRPPRTDGSVRRWAPPIASEAS